MKKARVAVFLAAAVLALAGCGSQEKRDRSKFCVFW